MNTLQFAKLLKDQGACREAVRWAKGKSFHVVWTTCERGDWLLWLCGKMVDQRGWPTRKQLVLAACACAETALRYVNPGEDRPRLAIETARAWTRGQLSIEDVKRAADAAYAASVAADAAYAAAYAATYATYAAATYAAYAAASAAAAYATYADIRGKALAECAEIVRREIPEPFARKRAAK